MTRSPHHGLVKSSVPDAQVAPATFHPGQQATPESQTVVNAPAAADQQTSGQAATSQPYAGESPTGYNPITLGAY